MASTAIAKYMHSEPVMRRFVEVLGADAPTFIAEVLVAVNTDPTGKLQRCTPESIYAAALQAAALRLSVDRNLGQAYLVPYTDRKSGRVEAQFQIGYRGLVALALRTGKFAVIHAGPVYEGQRYVEDPLTGAPRIEGERAGDKIIGYVAYFRLTNGLEKAEYMTVEELDAHGERYSPSYRFKSSPWQTHREEMRRKTVLRRLLKRWAPLNPRERALMETDTVRIAPAAPPAMVDEPSADEIAAALGFDTGAPPRAEAEVVVEDTDAPADPLVAAFQSAVADIVSDIPASAIASREARDAVAEVLGDAADAVAQCLGYDDFAHLPTPEVLALYRLREHKHMAAWVDACRQSQQGQ